MPISNNFSYGFYNSLNGDRVYNADHFAQLFNGIITDGVFEDFGNKLAVTPIANSMSVGVGTGRAWFNGTWTQNNDTYSVLIDPRDATRDRIDAVVLEVNKEQAVRANTFKVVKGSFGGGRPTLINSGNVHQHALAYVTVTHGTGSSIQASEITNVVGLSETPFVTAILQKTDVDYLYAQWDAEFHEWNEAEREAFLEWFAELEGLLSGDIVANLAGRILSLERTTATHHKEISFNLLASSWSGNTTTISVGGITQDLRCAVFGVAENATDDQYNAFSNGMLRVISHSLNTITIKAIGEVPNINIPCVIFVGKFDEFEGSDVLYGICSTAAATAAKTVTVQKAISLVSGLSVTVKFTNSNSAANPTLNVNSQGAKRIEGRTSWNAGDEIIFTYNGSTWSTIYDTLDGGSF